MRSGFLMPAVLCFAALPAWAHHGWGSYDSGNIVTITAPIETASYQNPHGTLTLKQGDRLWTVILSPPFRMSNRGLPGDELKPGTPVTVVGYPSRTHEGEMRAERITINGKTVELR